MHPCSADVVIQAWEQVESKGRKEELKNFLKAAGASFKSNDKKEALEAAAKKKWQEIQDKRQRLAENSSSDEEEGGEEPDDVDAAKEALIAGWFMKPLKSKALRAGKINEPRVLAELRPWLLKQGYQVVAVLDVGLLCSKERDYLGTSVDGIVIALDAQKRQHRWVLETKTATSEWMRRCGRCLPYCGFHQRAKPYRRPARSFDATALSRRPRPTSEQRAPFTRTFPRPTASSACTTTPSSETQSTACCTSRRPEAGSSMEF